MKLSRHVKNNMKLYKIDIVNVINAPDISERQGDKLVAIKKIPGKFTRNPLKVVYEKMKDDELIITAYPLKKKYLRKQ